MIRAVVIVLACENTTYMLRSTQSLRCASLCDAEDPSTSEAYDALMSKATKCIRRFGGLGLKIFRPEPNLPIISLSFADAVYWTLQHDTDKYMFIHMERSGVWGAAPVLRISQHHTAVGIQYPSLRSIRRALWLVSSLSLDDHGILLRKHQIPWQDSWEFSLARLQAFTKGCGPGWLLPLVLRRTLQRCSNFVAAVWTSQCTADTGMDHPWCRPACIDVCNGH